MTKVDLRETAAFLYNKAFEMDSTMPAPGFHALYQTSHACDWEQRDSLAKKCLSAFSQPLVSGRGERTAARVIASCAFTQRPYSILWNYNNNFSEKQGSIC